MNCETCNAKFPTIQTRLKRVNDALHKLGTEYHNFTPFEKIDKILTDNNFVDTNNSTDNAGGVDNFHAQVGDGKWLHITWYRMPSGKYEVTAYVN